MFKDYPKWGKVLFLSGVIMLVFSGILWFANGGYLKFNKAKAVDTSGCGGSSTNPGCFTEEWDATQVVGEANGYKWGGNSYIVTVPVNKSKDGSNQETHDCQLWGGYPVYYAVPGSNAATCQNNQSGMLEGKNDTPVVVHWHVDGKINQ